MKVLRIILSLSFSLIISTSYAQNEAKSGKQETDKISLKPFDGFYASSSLGFHNLFGGSFIDGIDVLAQDSRIVAELALGFRKQFINDRLVFGVEVQFGLTDGDLMHTDPAKQLEIEYKNDTQTGYGLTLGGVIGRQKKVLVFSYAYETTRKFDVNIQSRGVRFTQNDEQGMIRYGLGTEYNLLHRINLRAMVGRVRVDFGELITNIDVEDRLDVTMGVQFQL